MRSSLAFPVTLAFLLGLLVCVVPRTPADEFTHGTWIHGWRKHAGDSSEDLYAVRTSRYGFTLNVARLESARLGRLEGSSTYTRSQESGASDLESLPPARLEIEIEVEGLRYRATSCAAGRAKGPRRLSEARLWEAGRHVQHHDFPGLEFVAENGRKLETEARLDLVAWSDSLTLNLFVGGKLSGKPVTFRLGLEGKEGSWSQKKTFEGPPEDGEERVLSLTFRPGAPDSRPRRGEAEVSVKVRGGDAVPVHLDTTRNCLVASVRNPRRSFRTGYTDIRHYDEFEIRVEPGEINHEEPGLPFLLDLRPPANVTGLCPILCDSEGRPLGIPVQVSKNWHFRPMGNYLMAYLRLPVTEPATYLLRVAYGFYGGLPSASHAQLSLVGYGGHGRWDQLAIGCWGETICFDVDRSLVDIAITDIRMLMARSGSEGKKWGWTDAGWGGDWLFLRDARQPRYLPVELETAYLAPGPCLTDTRYRGFLGSGREVALDARVRTLRTDDYSRTFQTLTYTFRENVQAERVWFFQLGRTYHYATPRLAFGNGEGLLRELDAPESLRQGEPLVKELELTGDAPHWVAFVGARQAGAPKKLPSGYRSLIIREYRATLGGKLHRQPTISARVHRTDPVNLDLELGPPAGVREFHAGDRIELDLELITLPRQAGDYYGPDEIFRAHLLENPSSWKTTVREARGNDLEVEVRGGRMLEAYPLVIEVESPEVSFSIRGGVGWIPVRLEGLESPVEGRLFRIVDGDRIPYEPEVHGHDYWQVDRLETPGRFAKIFNLPSSDGESAHWVFTR